eukprot:gene7005-biopygen20965
MELNEHIDIALWNAVVRALQPPSQGVPEEGGTWVCTHSEQSGWMGTRPPCGPPVPPCTHSEPSGNGKSPQSTEVLVLFLAIVWAGTGICTHSQSGRRSGGQTPVVTKYSNKSKITSGTSMKGIFCAGEDMCYCIWRVEGWRMDMVNSCGSRTPTKTFSGQGAQMSLKVGGGGFRSWRPPGLEPRATPHHSWCYDVVRESSQNTAFFGSVPGPGATPSWLVPVIPPYFRSSGATRFSCISHEDYYLREQRTPAAGTSWGQGGKPHDFLDNRAARGNGNVHEVRMLPCSLGLDLH